METRRFLLFNNQITSSRFPSELEESKTALEGYESKANYEVAEKQKVEAEYKKKLQTVEAKLQALKRKQKVNGGVDVVFKTFQFLHSRQ